MIRRYLASLCLSLAFVLNGTVPALAKPAATTQTLVIGVDYNDPANQQEPQHRWFEYTDFFSRQVTVHTGDTLDFQAAPGSLHVVGLAPSLAQALQAYPTYYPVGQDPLPATGTGLPKIGLGPAQVSVTGGSTSGGGVVSTNPFGPPVCGDIILGQAPCTYSGGNDVEIAGPNPGLDFTQMPPVPAAVDWEILINAPPGTYTYFCTIHPGMQGTLTVVDASQPTTTQATINQQSHIQFVQDRGEGNAAEAKASVAHHTGGPPGTRIYTQNVGTGVADGHVTIDEMLPQQLSGLVPGDQVQFVWNDPQGTHTVTFPTNGPSEPSPFGYDCGTTFQSVDGPPLPPPCVDPTIGYPVAIGDPGTSPSGTVLTNPSQLVDSGILIGPSFGLQPTTQSWSVVISSLSAPGAYQYQCTVHDWMQGTLNVQTGKAAAQ
jgi:plastocyanin